MADSLIEQQPTINTWRGRNIEDLTREELLEMVRHLGRTLIASHDDHRRTFRAWEMCRKARS